MCNKRSNNNKKLNDYLSVGYTKNLLLCKVYYYDHTGEIEESVACEERSQQEETLYVSCRRLSIEWLTASLRLMGDSSVYSRFFQRTCVWLLLYCGGRIMCICACMRGYFGGVQFHKKLTNRSKRKKTFCTNIEMIFLCNLLLTLFL